MSATEPQRRHASTIGARVKERRRLLGMTVRGTAMAAGLSHSTVSRIENGERGANNRFVLAQIAHALRCTVPDLAGERAVPDAREAAGINAAVTETLQAIMAADPEYASPMTDAPPLQTLQKRVNAIRRQRVACDYAGALNAVPDVVRGLHAKLGGPEWREAMRALLLVQEAAASIVRYQGTASVSALISERMREAARRLDDPLMVSLAAFQRSHSSSACGAYDYARRVASGAVDALSTAAAGEGGTELLGMLMLTAAFAYYGEGNRSDASAYITEAKRLANRTGDTMTFSLFFGPTNIRIWEISMEADGGDPVRAVAIARQTYPAQVPQVQRQATFHVDLGRALSHIGRDEDAMRAMMEGERLAPTHVGADPLVWETVRDLIDRRKRRAVPPDVRAFCGRLGVAL